MGGASVNRRFAKPNHSGVLKMRSDRFTMLGIAGFVACLGWLCISPAASEEGFVAPPKTLAEAAEGAYKATAASYEAGRYTVEDMYRWSKRLMESQQANGKHPTAKAEHLARMAQLHQKVSALYATGSHGGDEPSYYATMFYALEAGADKSK
jgi:hypothetical protein